MPITGFHHAPIYDYFSAFGGLVATGSRLLMVYRKGTSHVGTGDYGDILSRYTTDGINWTEPVTIDDEAGVDLRNVSLGVGNTGRVILMYTRMNPDLGAQMYLSMVYRYSDDNGDTWSAAATLNDGAMVPETSSASTYGSVIVGNGGKLMQTWYGGVTAASDGIYSSFIATSNDNGATWSAPVTVVAGSESFSPDETSLVYLDSDDIVGLARNEFGNTFRQVKSTDNGVNWTDQGDVSFDNWATRSPPYLCTYDAKANVACYYANRTDLRIRRATASAADLLSGPSGWTLQPDLAEIYTYDAGYPAVVHYTDTELGWGWYYEAGAIFFFRSTDLVPSPPAPPAVHVRREKPPLRHSVMVTTPDGNHTYRWGQDDPEPEKALRDLNFGSGQPGGFDSMTATLPRKSNVDYADLELFSNIEVLNSFDEVVGEYRLDEAPKTAGDDFSISPNAVGWQAHLEDNKNCAEIFVDIALNNWNPPSTPMQVTAGTVFAFGDPETRSAPTGGTIAPPSLWTGFNGIPANQVPIALGLYDAGPAVPLGSIYYAWQKHDNTPAGPDDWEWRIKTNSDDSYFFPPGSPAGESTADLQGAGPGANTLTLSNTDNRFAIAQFRWNGLGSLPAAEDADIGVFWTMLAVYGRHGLTKQGSESYTEAKGFFASDVAQYAIETWCPELSVGTIDDTTFVIPQLEFRTPTTPAEIIKQVNRFHLFDWFVGPGKKFHYRERGSYGRNWLARIGPAKLDSTGQTASRCVTDVLISYQDTDGGGVSKTVGPVGSGADTEDASLHDSDTQNPANVAGIAVWATLDMGGVSTPAAATQVGARFLEEVNQLDHSGRAELTGWVMSDKGVTYPFSSVQAGDTITFLDAADTSPRRIVKATKAENTVSVDLDAPPEGVQALLERLGVQWTNLAAVGAPEPTEPATTPTTPAPSSSYVYVQQGQYGAGFGFR